MDDNFDTAVREDFDSAVEELEEILEMAGRGEKVPETKANSVSRSLSLAMRRKKRANELNEENIKDYITAMELLHRAGELYGVVTILHSNNRYRIFAFLRDAPEVVKYLPEELRQRLHLGVAT